MYTEGMLVVFFFNPGFFCLYIDVSVLNMVQYPDPRWGVGVGGWGNSTSNLGLLIMEWVSLRMFSMKTPLFLAIMISARCYS